MSAARIGGVITFVIGKDMDDLLRRLGLTALPERLSEIDDAVLTALAEQQNDARATSRLLSAAAVVALGVGYVGGSLTSAPVEAAVPKLVLAETALAPSSLLDPL